MVQIKGEALMVGSNTVNLSDLAAYQAGSTANHMSA